MAILVDPQSRNKCGFTTCPTLRVARLQLARRSFARRRTLPLTVADHVTVESFNQLKNVGYKIYEAAREIRKQGSRRGRRRVTTINMHPTPPLLTSQTHRDIRPLCA